MCANRRFSAGEWCLIASALLLALAFSGSPARAESVDPETPEAPPKLQVIHAVERGGFVQSEFGFNYFLTSIEGPDGQGRKYGLGSRLGVFVGYDILPMLSLSLGGTVLTAPGHQDNASPSGDLLFLAPMARLQLALVTTERNFLSARVGAGFAIGRPSDVAGQPFSGNGPIATAAVLFEHYTMLRHFALGIEGGVVVVTKPGTGMGVSLAPTLKYTF